LRNSESQLQPNCGKWQLGPEEHFPEQLLADIVVKRLMGTGKAFIAAYYIICFISKLIPIFAYFYIISSTPTYHPCTIPEPFYSTTSLS
jgi:hypothetical protein